MTKRRKQRDQGIGGRRPVKPGKRPGSSPQEQPPKARDSGQRTAGEGAKTQSTQQPKTERVNLRGQAGPLQKKPAATEAKKAVRPQRDEVKPKPKPGRQPRPAEGDSDKEQDLGRPGGRPGRPGIPGGGGRPGIKPIDPEIDGPIKEADKHPQKPAFKPGTFGPRPGGPGGLTPGETPGIKPGAIDPRPGPVPDIDRSPGGKDPQDGFTPGVRPGLELLTPNLDGLRPGILQGGVFSEGKQDAFDRLRRDCPLTLLPVRLETVFSGKNNTTLKVRIYPDELHIDDHDPILTAEEDAAGRAFWERIAAAETDEARQGLQNWLAEMLGEQRAAYVAEAVLAGGATVKGAVSPRPAMAKCLPKFWRVVGYRRLSNGTLQEGLRKDGVTIPSSVCVDLMLGEDGTGKAKDSAWLHDYAIARDDMGMAVDINLAGKSWVQSEGIALLLVYGVGSPASEAQAKKLGELLAAHRFASGFAFQVQGVPTNVVDGVATPVSGNPQEPDGTLAAVVDAALLAGDGKPADPKSAEALGSAANGARLAYLWGQDTNGDLSRLPGADRDEYSGPRWMNEALWPVTWGAYFEDLLTTPQGTRAIGEGAVSVIRDHFLTHVRGGGPLPALRVGQQPYGILPVRAHHLPMQWVNQDPLYEFLLVRLRNDWLAATSLVPKLSPGGNGTREEALSTVLEVLGGVPHPIRMLSRNLRNWRVEEQDSDLVELLAIFGLFFLAGDDPKFGFESRSILGQVGWSLTMLGDGMSDETGSELPEDEVNRLYRRAFVSDAEDQIDALNDLRGRINSLLPVKKRAGARAWIDYMIAQVKKHRDRLNPLRAHFSTWLESDTLKGVLAKRADDITLGYCLYGDTTREVTQPLVVHIGVADGSAPKLPRNYLPAIATSVANDPKAPLGEFDLRPGGMNPLGGALGVGGAGETDSVTMVPRRRSLAAAASEGQRASSRSVVASSAAGSRTPVSGTPRATAGAAARLQAGDTPFITMVDPSTLGSLRGTTGLAGWNGTRPGLPSSGPEPLLKQLAEAAAARVPEGQRNDFKDALNNLADLPEATLAWNMRETLGLATNRLDAWLTGLASERMSELTPDGRAQFGGYGFVLDLRPDGGSAESTGYIHAPTQQLAATAGILRSAWEGHGEDDENSPLAVNLSSARLRMADRLIQGVSQGLSLGALLGQDFERGLHDAGLDKYLDEVRAAVLDASGAKGKPRGPLDGLDLLEVFETGKLDGPLKVTGSDYDQIKKLIQQTAENFDALGDAGLVEATHYLAQGNSERASAILDAISLGEAPPSELRHARTDTAKAELAHNVALVLDPTKADGKGAGRSASHPGLTDYVDQHLPKFRNLKIDVVDGQTVHQVALNSLGLGSLDMVMEAASPGALGARIMGKLWIEGVKLSAEARVPSSLLAQGEVREVSAEVEEFEETCVALVAHIGALRPMRLEDTGHIASVPEDYLDLDHSEAVLTATAKRLEGILQTLKKRRKSDNDKVQALLDGAVEFMPELLPGPECYGVESKEYLRGFLEASVTRIEKRIEAITSGASDSLDDLLARYKAMSGGAVAAELMWSGISPAMARAPSFTPPSQEELNDWLGLYAHVRPDVASFARVRETSELIGLTPPPLDLAQWSDRKSKAWLGASLPETDAPGGVSWVMVDFGGRKAARRERTFTGYIVDKWIERLPDKKVLTSVAAQFDAPSSRPPQAILMATTPNAEIGWSDDLLSRTLIETIENIQARAVTTRELEGYGHHLPAIFVEGGLDEGPQTIAEEAGK